MAVQFDPKKLGAFLNVDFGNDDAIANLDEGKDGLKQKGKLGSFILKPFRSPATTPCAQNF
ncbi:MAG: hypothetical protein IJS08_14340 [Victivallales bacterium]|nr:hypothetical protein [Victivallales bacterium]